MGESTCTAPHLDSDDDVDVLVVHAGARHVRRDTPDLGVSDGDVGTRARLSVDGHRDSLVVASREQTLVVLVVLAVGVASSANKVQVESTVCTLRCQGLKACRFQGTRVKLAPRPTSLLHPKLVPVMIVSTPPKYVVGVAEVKVGGVKDSLLRKVFDPGAAPLVGPPG